MKKNNLNEAKEELKRALLMMKYDNSKTLTENYSILEQSQTNEVDAGTMSEIVDDIVDDLDGIVDTGNLKNILSRIREIKGKKYRGNDAIQELKRLYMIDESGDILADDIRDVGTTTLDAIAVDIIDDILIELGESPKFTQSAQSCPTGQHWDSAKSSCVPDTTDDGKLKDDGKTTGKYKQCSNQPFDLYCINSEIGKVQGCLGGLRVDNHLGPLTQAALKNIGIELPLDQSEIDKVCKKQTSTTLPEKEKPKPESDNYANNDFYNS